MAIPLSAAELRDLLNHPADYGPLSDPARRASCLSGLGYPASTPVLGGRPVEINARPGIVLVLPADAPNTLAVFAVALNCSAADTGLLADTQIPRA
ncbi:putative alanine rich protein [Mycobacterium rhizamassiliense]|uniref:Putative alanine rich protein n=1 Tax=Mycobacterium rhizamassiliense TaxID=1841860 RepID=A0A2U3NR21_9MYCO|nr:putative alanine rich protein [Mycobacterium rhizamassiliense]